MPVPSAARVSVPSAAHMPSHGLDLSARQCRLGCPGTVSRYSVPVQPGSARYPQPAAETGDCAERQVAVCIGSARHALIRGSGVHQVITFCLVPGRADQCLTRGRTRGQGDDVRGSGAGCCLSASVRLLFHHLPWSPQFPRLGQILAHTIICSGRDSKTRARCGQTGARTAIKQPAAQAATGGPSWTAEDRTRSVPTEAESS